MAFIEWTEKNKTNVAICDEQHKKLFTIINKLHEAMKNGKGKEIIGSVLSELIDYTVYHFKTEEELMEKYGFPGRFSHKREHEDLAKKALDLNDRFKKGEPVLTIEVMNFLKGWLTNHTTGSDKKYGEFLNAKGVF